MKKLIIVSEYVSSSQNSTGYFWSKLIGELAAAFDSVYVIARSVSNSDADDLQWISDVNFIEVGNLNYNKNSIASRILGQLKFSIKFFWEILKVAKKDDLILCGTNPALFVLLMPIFKVFFGCKCLILAHDVFPENSVSAGLLKDTSALYKFLKKVFDISYESAERIYVIGRDMEKIISQKIKYKKITQYIPNWVYPEDVTPIGKNNSEIIKSLGWNEFIVFQFFGNIGRAQGVENILSAIPLVSSRNVAFLFLGDGVHASLLGEFEKNHPYINFRYLGPISQSKKNEGLSACDVAIITLQDGMDGLGVPSKSYFTMAADRYILAIMQPTSEVAQMVTDNNIGWQCLPSNPSRIAEKIDEISRILTDAKSLSLLSSPRKVFLNQYNGRNLTKEIVSDVKLLIN